MTDYAVRRLMFSVFVVWGVVTVIFVLLRVLPGDPAALMLGTYGTSEEVAALSHELGMDRPIYAQYWHFVRDAITGNLGQSTYYRVSCTSLIAEVIPHTLQLALPTVVIATSLAIPLGVVAALRVNGPWDRAIRLFTLVAQSMPGFWVAVMLILLLSRTLRLLPTSGRGTFWHMVMPVVTLSLPMLAFMSRLVRSSVLEALSADYVRTARGKGLAEDAVMRRHVLGNILIPIVTLIGLQVGALLGGVVVVETVFAWPGVGRLMLTAIRNRDFALVQACALFISLVYVAANLIVDISYAYIDPRVRYGDQGGA